MRLDQMDHQLGQRAAEMQADLDAYRDDWSSRSAEELRAHNERMREMEADQRAWFKSFYEDDDESAPENVGQGHGASATGPAPGRGPGQPIHEAELAEAERIRSMSMQEYAARRAEFGIQSPTAMSRLSGQ